MRKTGIRSVKQHDSPFGITGNCSYIVARIRQLLRFEMRAGFGSNRHDLARCRWVAGRVWTGLNLGHERVETFY